MAGILIRGLCSSGRTRTPVKVPFSMTMREEHEHHKKFYGGLLCRPGLTTGEAATELGSSILMEMRVQVMMLEPEAKSQNYLNNLARPDGPTRGSDLQELLIETSRGKIAAHNGAT